MQAVYVFTSLVLQRLPYNKLNFGKRDIDFTSHVFPSKPSVSSIYKKIGDVLIVV